MCSLKRRIGNYFSSFVFEMATEKTRLLLAIARRRLFVKEIITRHARFELTKRIIELARKARQENLTELDAIAVIGVHRESNDPKAIFAIVVRKIFDDGVVHWGKIVAFFALTIYFQRRFELELENEVIDFVEELFPDLIDNRKVPVGWDVVGFFTNSFFISLSIKLMATMFHLESKASALK